jgi:hypothetical protein
LFDHVTSENIGATIVPEPAQGFAPVIIKPAQGFAPVIIKPAQGFAPVERARRSVSRVLSGPLARPWTAIPLGRASRRASRDQPG